ncbi:MAG: hypothetical protein J0L53_15715 [Spirochaetes bacterium]|nr:hypothetical protein [Spirochaetota bacterium]MBX3720379.1 hypothetical protein [Turneriella sp.]
MLNPTVNILRKSLFLIIVLIIACDAVSAARRRRARAKPRKAVEKTEQVEKPTARTAPADAATENKSAPVAVASSSDEVIPGSGTNVVAETPETAPGATAKAAPSFLITGFLDMGFAMAQNKGVGFMKDVNNYFPEYSDKTAVFLGDPASTYMNTRHEAHDLGEAGNFPLAFDTMQGKGNPMATINSATIDMIAEIHEKVRLQISTEFLLRQNVVQNVTGNGNFVNLDMAFIDYKPFQQYDITLTAGKFIGITGIEYRWRRAPDRWTVTPTLVGRYMDGNPIGVKVRGKHFDKRFIWNVGLTNGNSFTNDTRIFESVETNLGKTVAGRLSYDFAFGPITLLELGVSGSWGPQDAQSSNNPKQWDFGPDLQVAWKALQVRGQWFKINTDGGGINEAKNYIAEAWYIEGMYSFPGLFDLVNTFGIYTRVSRRVAREIDPKYVFIVDVLQVTPGIRVDITENIIFKAEYSINMEVGVLSNYAFSNDIFTSSLVAKF